MNSVFNPLSLFYPGRAAVLQRLEARQKTLLEQRRYWVREAAQTNDTVAWKLTQELEHTMSETIKMINDIHDHPDYWPEEDRRTYLNHTE